MHALYLILTFLLTVGSLLLLHPVASRVGLLDHPGGRKHHHDPTPMVGGLGIYLGLLCIALVSASLPDRFVILLAVAGIVLLSGLIDDLREMRVSLRFAIHGIACGLMISLTDLRLESLGDLVFTGPILLTGWLSITFTIFAALGVINAINMSDGLDGLSAGIVAISLIFLSIAAVTSGHEPMLHFNQLLLMGLLAFLLLNFRILSRRGALVYLGDSGSTLLGFLLAWLMIDASQGTNAFIAPIYALWFLAVPLLDTVSLLILRPLRGQSPFQASHDHLHHRLIAKGYSRQQTVLILYATAAILAGIGLAALLANVHEGIMFLAFVALFAAYLRFDPFPATRSFGAD
ncbi:MAG: hypothetical protein ACQETO_12975 [Pseudomonadota bacterium]